ncbi:TetR family transcriptional regulator [Streptomyces sp. SID685]|uniref:TetR/AcrR family transcriptional regulator n=1 Tax=Streptomyces TaxID=1883 RepID=UPI00136E73F9|nr:TetR/AcrR family transcriptional regulator [Streptomyces sp. SID685]MYR88923.1 TetR family transcriptional regulator [Streptomyces sp. SID685]
MLSDPEVEVLTIPAVAQRAGVNHTSIYRRWGNRDALLADVAVTQLEEHWPLPDTGSLRGDLLAWAEAGESSLTTPRGQLVMRALALSMPRGPQSGAGRAQLFAGRIHAIEELRARAIRRGENPPAMGQILDQILAPLYFRAILGLPPESDDYPQILVGRLLGSST